MVLPSRAAREWSQHSYRVLSTTKDLAIALRDAERGQRGYVLTGRDEYLAFQRGLDRVHDVAGELRQVRQRLVPHFRAVAVGAAQQPRLVLAALPVRAGVRALDPDHVHRRRLVHHERIVTAHGAIAAATRPAFPDYTPRAPGGSRAWSGTRFQLRSPVTSG